MKTKLLKKIRKRFSWFFSLSGVPIIIDFKRQKAFKVDEEFIREKYGPREGSIEDFYKVSLETVAQRIALTELGKDFGVEYSMPYKKFKTWSKRAKKLRQKGEVVYKKNTKLKT